MCLGSQYVKSVLFLMISNILQRFTLKFPTDQPKPTLEPEDYAILRPKPYKVCAIQR